MLDLNDFIAERGGDVKKIKESQRKRFAPEEAVDDVIALYEEARKGRFMPGDPRALLTAIQHVMRSLKSDPNSMRS